jgi:DNA-binding transcriptional LysR family regulator
LGQILFARTTRQLHLTEAGQIYLEEARYILQAVSNAVLKLSHIDKDPHGEVNVGFSGIFETQAFAEHIKEFVEAYPKIQLNSHHDMSPISVLEGKLDVVVSEMNMHDPSLIKEPLCKATRQVYAAPTYLKKWGTPKTIEELLKQHHCLIYTKVSPDDTWALNGKKIKVPSHYRSNSPLQLRHAAYAGVGLIWSTDLLAAEDVAAGKLVPVPLPGKIHEMQIFLYYKPTISKPIRLLVEHLQEFVVK